MNQEQGLSNSFCKLISEQANEPLAGTAPYQKRLVLISWPKRLWPQKALASEGLPPELKSWMEAASATHGPVQIRLVNLADASTQRVQLWIYPEAETYTEVEPANILSVLQEHFAGKTQGQPDPVPKLLVCTHGKRDKCCAKFGQCVLSRLREKSSENSSRLEVLESSHIGGHRFAATALVLPEMRYYGRLQEQDATELLQCLNQGRVFQPRNRGLATLPNPDQLAEDVAQQLGFASGNSGQPSFELLDNDQQSTRRYLCCWNMEDQTQLKRLIQVSKTTLQVPKDCTALDEFPPLERWVVVAEEEV